MIPFRFCDINKLLRAIIARGIINKPESSINSYVVLKQGVSSINQNPHADSSTQNVWRIIDELFLFDVNEQKENFDWTHRLA